MAKPFIPVARIIRWLAMNVDMAIRLLMRVHVDVAPIVNGVEARQRARKSIAVHQEHYLTDGNSSFYSMY